MKRKVLITLLSILLVLLLGTLLWFITKMHGYTALEKWAFATSFLAIGHGLTWIAFGAFLIYSVLPRIDKIVAAGTSDFIEHAGDSLFLRIHRLLMYSFAASSRWGNIRVHPEFDFSNLEAELRTPVIAFYYWLVLGVITMAFSYVLGRWG